MGKVVDIKDRMFARDVDNVRKENTDYFLNKHRQIRIYQIVETIERSIKKKDFTLTRMQHLVNILISRFGITKHDLIDKRLYKDSVTNSVVRLGHDDDVMFHTEEILTRLQDLLDDKNLFDMFPQYIACNIVRYAVETYPDIKT